MQPIYGETTEIEHIRNMKIGDKVVHPLYIGSKQVKAAYMGGVMVYGDKEIKVPIITGYKWEFWIGLIVSIENMSQYYSIDTLICEFENLKINDVSQTIANKKLTFSESQNIKEIYISNGFSHPTITLSDCINFTPLKSLSGNSFKISFRAKFYFKIKTNTYGGSNSTNYMYIKCGIDDFCGGRYGYSSDVYSCGSFEINPENLSANNYKEFNEYIDITANVNVNNLYGTIYPNYVDTSNNRIFITLPMTFENTYYHPAYQEIKNKLLRGFNN